MIHSPCKLRRVLHKKLQIQCTNIRQQEIQKCLRSKRWIHECIAKHVFTQQYWSHFCHYFQVTQPWSDMNNPAPGSPCSWITPLLDHPAPGSPLSLITLLLYCPAPGPPCSLIALLLDHPSPGSSYSRITLLLDHPAAGSPLSWITPLQDHPAPGLPYSWIALLLDYPAPGSKIFLCFVKLFLQFQS